MITDSKINEVQKKIKAAIAQIEKDENVKISFGNIRYNSAYYTSQLKVSTLEKTEKVTSVLESICRNLGFTQNVIGMKFMSNGREMEIIDIKTRNRKFPIIVKTIDNKQYKMTVSQIKLLIGGDKIINRNANLDKLIND
jgi:hypothetical protein